MSRRRLLIGPLTTALLAAAVGTRWRGITGVGGAGG